MKKHLLYVVPILLMLISLFGCDTAEELTEPEEQNSPPVAVAGADQSVSLGETVSLDGTDSTDPDGDALSFQWSLESKPDDSNASISNATQSTASFVADVRGSYSVRLTVSDGEENHSDNLTVNAEIQEIGSIDANTTLHDVFDDPALTDYMITGTAYIRAALTIAPGVKIEFGSGAELNVTTDGVLIAIGTEQDSIRFTGSSQTAGYWDGIDIHSNNPSNELQYCVVEYGGNDEGNIYVSSVAQLKLSHTSSRYSGTDGLYAAGDAQLPTFNQNKFSNNSEAALEINAQLLGSLDSLSRYAGNNTNEYIDVQTATISSDQIWQVTDAPYRFQAYDTDIAARVTIRAGATFMFADGAGLAVNTGGAIIAEGTATDSIRFTGEVKSPGYWDGIDVQSNTIENSFTYCAVEYGGGDDGNISIGGDAQLNVTHTTSRFSGSDGLYASTTAKLPTFSQNKFTQNNEAAMEIPAVLIGSLDNASSYAGNTRNYIDVQTTAITTTQTWPKTDAPYRFQAYDTDISNGVVTIEPGATLMFAQGAGLAVNMTGVLNAIGTSVEPITFTGEQKSAGFWDGIEISSNQPDNALSYCVVEYAGGDLGNIYVGSDAQLQITNSVSQYSADDGIYVNSNSSKLPTFANNQFIGNGEAALELPANLIGALDGASTYAGGNTNEYIDVKSTSITTTQTWPKTDAPYRFQVYDTDISNGTVTIAPGATLTFADGAGLSTSNTGVLVAIGTAQDSIRFTGQTATAGWWDGIEIGSNQPDNELRYCVVSYGGGDYGNININSNSQLKVNDSSIRHSADWGIYLNSSDSSVDPADPTTTNEFKQNPSGAVRTP